MFDASDVCVANDLTWKNEKRCVIKGRWIDIMKS